MGNSTTEDYRSHPFVFLSSKDFAKLSDHFVSLDADEANHIRKSLRLRGDVLISVSDGSGNIKICRLDDTNRIQGQIEQFQVSSGFNVSLVSVPIKKKRMETLIQKAVELGVKEVTFLESDNMAVTKESGQKRYEKIAKEACKQSKNPFLPIIHFSLHNTVLNYPYSSSLQYYWGDWNQQPDTVSLNSKLDAVFINGPEGGWSEREKEFLKNRFPCINLSQNVLRSETAAMLAVYELKRRGQM